MPRITFVHPQGLSGEVEPNTSILEASKTLGFPLTHDCGGNASCTTCRVEVESGGGTSPRSISTSRTCWTGKI